jgi:hypothetical protein
MVNGWMTAHSCRIRWGCCFRTAGVWCHFATGKCNTLFPSWCAKSGAVLGQGNVGTSSLFSRSCLMWLLVCMCERTSSWKMIWIWRWYQCCYHCLFTELQLIIYHVDGKVCVDSSGDYIE